jgi:hypothetical protein
MELNCGKRLEEMLQCDYYKSPTTKKDAVADVPCNEGLSISKKFEEVARPLIDFINENYHPHVTVIVDSTHAEILEGISAFTTEDYLRD